MEHRIRVGLVGADAAGQGWAPLSHLPALRLLPEYELAAVCTAHADTAAAAAAKYGVGRAFHDYKTLVREADEFAEATELLGYPYFVTAQVVHGDKRGRTLGYPTANLRLGPDCGLKHGVYAVRVHVGGSQHPGVANLGFNPTFSEQAHHLEAHLFDFDADLYGQRIEVSFIKRLRGETKFATAQALSEQIARDAAAARRALADTE
jgi:hypothetical protein